MYNKSILFFNICYTICEFFIDWGSAPHNGLSALKPSLRESTVAIGLYPEKTYGCVKFSGGDVLSYILGLSEDATFAKRCDDLLHPLTNYDKANGTGYTDFLKAFLRNNANTIKTSRELFIHRNTALYQLHKVESILGCNLSSEAVKAELLIALAVRCLQL